MNKLESLWTKVLAIENALVDVVFGFDNMADDNPFGDRAQTIVESLRQLRKDIAKELP